MAFRTSSFVVSALKLSALFSWSLDFLLRIRGFSVMSRVHSLHQIRVLQILSRAVVHLFIFLMSFSKRNC